MPSYVKEKRFHNWLEGAHDWAISRSRWVHGVLGHPDPCIVAMVETVSILQHLEVATFTIDIGMHESWLIVTTGWIGLMTGPSAKQVGIRFCKYVCHARYFPTGWNKRTVGPSAEAGKQSHVRISCMV